MSGPILRTKRLKILDPLQDETADHVLVRNSVTKEVSSLPKESVFDADNIKTEIVIDVPLNPTLESFANAINALPLFSVDGKTIPTFKAVTTGETPVVYYAELLNLGKGTYGVTGTQLTASNIKVTVVTATVTDIAELSSTQIIDLGNQGDDVVTAMNRQMPNIIIQDQNDGYTIVKGIFLNGQFHEYLWIGTAGTYGRDVLQTTDQDFKELSSVSQGVARATNTYSGTVKTDVYKEDPTVYTTQTVDNLLAGKANTFTEIKTITGIAYTPILSDVTKELLYEGTLPMNITIPNNSTEPFPAGTSFYTLGTNTGIVSASAAAGVTLKYKAGMSLSAVQNEIRKYTKQGVNTWLVDGSVAASATKLPYTAYINTTSGNNTTAVLGDSSKPFLTDLAAYNALPASDGNYWSLCYLDSNVVRVMTQVPNRKIRIISDNEGVFKWLNLGISNLILGTHFEIIAPLSDLWIEDVASTQFSPSTWLNIEVNKITLKASQTSTYGILGYSLDATNGINTGKIICDWLYIQKAVRVFQYIGTFRARKITFASAGIELKNAPLLLLDFRVDEVEGLNYAVELTKFGRTNNNHQIKKYLGTHLITDYLSESLNVTGKVFTCPSFIYNGGGVVSGTMFNTSYAISQPYSISIYDGFHGRLANFNYCNTHVFRNCTIYTSSKLASTQGDSSLTPILTFDNTTILQDAPTSLFENQRAGTFFDVKKIGVFRTNATSLYMGSNGSATVTDITPNTY